jgi:Zn finger protein HypA/HybF involved in hydrogenase expression
MNSKPYNCKWCHTNNYKDFYDGHKNLCQKCKKGKQKIDRGNLTDTDSVRLLSFGYNAKNIKNNLDILTKFKSEIFDKIDKLSGHTLTQENIINNDNIQSCDKCSKMSNIIQNFNNEIENLKMEIDALNQIIISKDETIEELNDIVAEKDQNIFQLEISNSLYEIKHQDLKSNSDKINTKKSKSTK